MNAPDFQFDFQYPKPPEKIPAWAEEEARPWRDLDDFDLQVQLEEKTGLAMEIQTPVLSPRLWAFTYTNRQLGRCRIFVNGELPFHWQRFALFHEIHHLLHDCRGCYFWGQTLTPLSRFETQADMFAWAAVLPSWEDDSSW